MFPGPISFLLSLNSVLSRFPVFMSLIRITFLCSKSLFSSSLFQFSKFLFSKSSGSLTLDYIWSFSGEDSSPWRTPISLHIPPPQLGCPEKKSDIKSSFVIHFWTVVLEKALKSPLDCKEIQPVHSEGDQPWDFFGRNDSKAETPVLWPPHVKSWLIGKDSDVGRDWGQEVKGTTGWDGWMASPTRWTWVWVNSGSWWWTGRPGVLQFMGSQTVRHDWATELNWTELNYTHFLTDWDKATKGLLYGSTSFTWEPYLLQNSIHYCELTSNFFFS